MKNSISYDWAMLFFLFIGQTPGRRRGSVKHIVLVDDKVGLQVFLFSSFEKRAGVGVPGSLDSGLICVIRALC